MNRKLWMRGVPVFLVTALLSGIFFWYAGKSAQERMAENQQYTADNEAEKFRQELEYYIQATGYLESMLVAADGDYEGWEATAAQLIDEATGLLEIWIAPESIVAAVWPEDESVPGTDVTTLPGLPADAETFIGSGNTVILGPQKLEVITRPLEDAQGDNGSSKGSYMQQLLEQAAESEGLEVRDLDEGFTVSDEVAAQLADRVIVIYNPVYIDGKFWGFINAAVSAYRIFADAGLLALDDAGYNYMVFQMNEAFDLYSVLTGGDSLDMPAEALFTLGGWEWSIDVARKPELREKGFGPLQALLSLGLGLLVMSLYVYRARHREEEALITRKNEEISLKADQLQQARETDRAKTQQLQQAHEANRAKTEFVSRISHDIRTPIGAILNLTEFAKRDINDPEKLQQDLGRIESSGKFLLSLINDVLDISKVDSGKIELGSETVNYDAYLKSLSDLMETMCGEKQQTFELSSDHERGLCFTADKVRLRQIALNLLSNAVKYSPAGTVVRYESTVVEESGGNVGLTFTVRDQGIGMSPEFQAIMFEEFSQEYDNPLRESGTQGTGLGLPIVKKLVDLMGGTMDVQSARGEGTAITVSLHFPKAESRSADADGSDAAAQQEPIRAHILFAEDNVINTEIASRIFEEMGVTADHAPDGAKAVEMFEASTPGTYDAIFMDLQMPVMTGLEATEKIRSLDRMDAQAVPVIAMTADAFREAMDRAAAAGMNEYITKPLVPERIREILEKIVKNEYGA